MKNNPMRKYWIECLIAAALLVAALIVVVICIPQPWTAILFVLGFFAYSLYVRWSVKRNFVPILTHEMDPDRFKETVLSGKGLLPNATFTGAHALYTGDYQTVINVYSHFAKKYRVGKKRTLCLSYLARAYFELGDTENLKAVCSRIQRNDGMLAYYRAYAVGQYEECIAICKEKDAKADDPKQPPVGAVNSCLHYAFAYAKLGQRETACKYFTEIVKTAPKLYAATIAQDYLNGGDLPQITDIWPQKDVFLGNPIRTRGKKALFLLGLLVLAGFALQSLADTEDKTADFDHKLDAAVSAGYTNGEVLAVFSVGEDKESAQTMCVIQSDGKLDVCVAVSYDHGATVDLVKLVEDIKIRFFYNVKNPVDQQIYSLIITTYDPPVNADTAVAAFTFNGLTHWLRVTCVG